MAYAREVYDYNKCVTEGALRPNLVHKFAKVAETFDDPVRFYITKKNH